MKKKTFKNNVFCSLVSFKGKKSNFMEHDFPSANAPVWTCLDFFFFVSILFCSTKKIHDQTCFFSSADLCKQLTLNEMKYTKILMHIMRSRLYRTKSQSKVLG